MQRTPYAEAVAEPDAVQRVCPHCGAPLGAPRVNQSYVEAVLFARKSTRGTCSCVSDEGKPRAESRPERNSPCAS